MKVPFINEMFFVLVLVFGNNSYLTQLLQTANTQHKPYSEGALLAFWWDSRFSLFNILFSFFCWERLLLPFVFPSPCACASCVSHKWSISTNPSRSASELTFFSFERVVVGNFELKLLFLYSFFLSSKPPSVLTRCCPCISEWSS